MNWIKQSPTLYVCPIANRHFTTLYVWQDGQHWKWRAENHPKLNTDEASYESDKDARCVAESEYQKVS